MRRIIFSAFLFLLCVNPIFSNFVMNLQQTNSEYVPFGVSKRRNLQENLENGQNSEERNLSNNDNSAQLTNIFNIHYNVPIFIGNPKKEFRLILDTGSNWLWVGSSSCENCYRIGIGDLYQCSASQTCLENQDNMVDIKYGIGYVSGFITKDMVSLDSEGKLGVDQEFLQIRQIQGLEQLKGEGVLGIGKKGLIPGSYMTFIENLKKQGKIQNNMFSLYLLGNECKEDSKIIIGGYNESLFEGDITYVKVVDDDFWNIPIENLFFKKKNETKSIDSIYKKALIDSGSSEIVMNSNDLEEIISYFKTIGISCEMVENYQGVPQMTCEEGDDNNYPSFNVQINGSVFTIEPKDYIANCYFKYFKYLCRLHFIADDTLKVEEIIILGQTFLNSYYSIYDIENNRIGLAKTKKYEIQKHLSLKTTLFQVLGIIIVTNLLLFLLEFLCVNLKVCAKIEGLNVFEKLFKDLIVFPDVLVDEVMTERKSPLV